MKQQAIGLLAILSIVCSGSALAVVTGDGPGGVGTTDGTSALQLWLKTDVGVSHAGDGSSVGAWQDQSGRGNHTAGAAGYPPIFESGPGDTLNGLPVVRFVADYLNSVTLSSVANEFTIAVVVDPDAIGTYHCIIEDENSNRPMLWIDPWNGYEHSYRSPNGAAAGYVVPSRFDIVFAVKRNGYGPELYLNGSRTAAVGSSAYATQTTEVFDLFNRDGGQRYQGKLAEMIVYETALTPEEIDAVGTYLQQRFAIDAAFGPDPDGDGVPTTDDNCPKTSNADQWDADGDGVGDACDGCDVTNVPELSDYTEVYALDIPTYANYSTGVVPYHEDNTAGVSCFDRVAYCMELETDNGLEWVWVSMDTFTDDPAQTGVPVAATGATFQQVVNDMNVFSNAPGVVTGTGITTGNIEFWSNCYAQGVGLSGVGGSGNTYDFNDTLTTSNCYGSMQVHNWGESQTLFAYNRWIGHDGYDDLGIGNSPTGHPDWTFRYNTGHYASRRLQVFVRDTPDVDTDGDGRDDGCDICPGISNPEQQETAACIAMTDQGDCWEAQVELVGDSETASICGNVTVDGEAERPSTLTYEILNTSCGYGDTFEFFLNGVSLGTTTADPYGSCTCSPGIARTRTATVTGRPKTATRRTRGSTRMGWSCRATSSMRIATAWLTES